MNVSELTLELCKIDSTTGQEGELAHHTAKLLENLGFEVKFQEVEANRLNLLAIRPGATPKILLTTHLDTVPPYFPAKLEDGILTGRGVCDAKGIMAAMICAAKDLGPEVGLLFVVGEEVDSIGAIRAASGFAPQVSYFINGEPTDSKVASAMKGALAFELQTSGKTGHSAYPELGSSAVHKLINDLNKLLNYEWPENKTYGQTTLNIGRIEGGRAANVIADKANAVCVMRATVDESALQETIKSLISPSTSMKILTTSSPMSLMTFEKIPDLENCIVRFGSDVPHLNSIGTPILFGPGSILDAHTANEKISVSELEASVQAYKALCEYLIQA